MIPMDDSYEHLIDPINFIKNFPEVEGFKEWARQGTINDLKETIRCYEKKELYLHCKYLQDVIDEKGYNYLSGFGFN